MSQWEAEYYWLLIIPFNLLFFSVLLLTVPGMEETTSDADKTLPKQSWDTKKVGIAPFKA